MTEEELLTEARDYVAGQCPSDAWVDYHHIMTDREVLNVLHEIYPTGFDGFREDVYQMHAVS